MFEIKLIFYGLSCILQFSEFVWALSYSMWDVFNNFLLINATDRSKISSDQKPIPPFFFANTPFNLSHFLHQWFLSTVNLLHTLTNIIIEPIQHDISFIVVHSFRSSLKFILWVVYHCKLDKRKRSKELILCHKLWFSNHYIFGTKCCRP